MAFNRTYTMHACLACFAVLLYAGTFFLAYPLESKSADSQFIDTLRNKISDQNSALDALEKEIKLYEQKLKQAGSERQTLESALRALEASRGKLEAQIKLTERQIDKADGTIQSLEATIARMTTTIAQNREATRKALQDMDEAEQHSLAELVLGNGTFSDLWNDVDALTIFQERMSESVAELSASREALAQAKQAEGQKRNELSRLSSDLSGEKHALEATRSEKKSLLTVTKNKEANYQTLLKEKQAARTRAENELRTLEATLNIAIDQSKIPAQGGHTLTSPVPGAPMTQGYGLTSFALSGAYGYNASGQPNPHRGVDYGVGVGTPIRAALSGVVKGVENMDAYPGCYSFGKWILLEHPNGLSTLYAHLSSFSVSPGQSVETGQIIGASGNSGYSTNPHLHFGVYATQGVRVQKYITSNGCKNALVPLASPDAYLNPMNYL